LKRRQEIRARRAGTLLHFKDERLQKLVWEQADFEAAVGDYRKAEEIKNACTRLNYELSQQKVEEIIASGVVDFKALSEEKEMDEAAKQKREEHRGGGQSITCICIRSSPIRQVSRRSRRKDARFR